MAQVQLIQNYCHKSLNLNFLIRVRGIRNLRVADASALPRTTNANINAAVMLVAEKASQDILGCYAACSGSGGSVPF